MVFLSFVYRFVTNFAFMAMVYFSLNFMEKYQNRAIISILVLVYTGMRAASTLRAFYFYQKIEKLEVETRRLQGPINDGSGGTNARKQVVADVARLRRDGEIKSYMDLFFLALIVLLCVAAIMRQ
jgi:Na+/H+ antiporter NhaC